MDDNIIFSTTHFHIWDKSQGFSVEALITSPYELEGKIPMIFINIGFIQVVFENSFLHKIIFKRQYGWDYN